MNELTYRLNRLTQRLDHMVPDNGISSELNDRAATILRELSERLIALLPDPSLSPDERLERIARAVQDRVPQSEQLLPAIQKVHRLERRLLELVPGDDLDCFARLERLVCSVESVCEEKGITADQEFVRKLELLGDQRAGFLPIK